MSSQSTPLDELYASFASLNMEGGWHRRFPALWSEPRENFLPHIWHYDAVKPILARAGELIDTELAERRNLTMFNPVEGNVYSTVRTIVAAYQMVRPGEFARAHRHTPNALRLILEGSGTYTVVDGKEVEMRPGDVLLTPNWAWHSHENKGDEDCYWMDFLDVPLVHLLEPMFYQPHPEGRESDVVPLAQAPIAFRADDIAARLQAIHQPLVEVQALGVELAVPRRLHARPGDREAVAAQAHAGDQRDVLLVAVVVVAGHIAGVAIRGLARGVAEHIPDRGAAAVVCGGALDLVGGGGHPPVEVLAQGAQRLGTQAGCSRNRFHIHRDNSVHRFSFSV